MNRILSTVVTILLVGCSFIPANEFIEPPSYSPIGGALSYNVGEDCPDPTSVDDHNIIRRWPLDSVKVTQGFTSWAHPALDLRGLYGVPVRAVGYGFVEAVEYMKDGYGWHVIINHPEGWQSLYAHMWSEPSIKKGDYMFPGKVIGSVGSTGNSSGSHLHFELLYNSCNIDPSSIIK